MEQSQALPINSTLDSHEEPLSTLRLNTARSDSIPSTYNLPLNHTSTSSTIPAEDISSPIKRKPVGSSTAAAATVAAASPSSEKTDHAVAADPGVKLNFSIPRKSLSSGEDRVQEQIVSAPRQPLDRRRPILSPDIPQSPGFTPFHELPPEQARQVLLNLDENLYSPSTLAHVRNSDPPQPPLKSRPRPRHHLQLSEAMPGRVDGPGPIHILPMNYASQGPPTPSGQNVSKFGAFFGWKGKPPSSPINDSSPTTISDRSTPAQSPNGTSLTSFPSGKMLPSVLDTSRTNAPAAALFSSAFPQAPPTPALAYQLEEMESELREISSELAGSIRREMELEVQVERLQLDGPNALEKDKRTSDYFSDSGASSTRDPEVPVMKIDDMEKLNRRSEQEKAQMKLDLSQNLQDERARRKRLEEHVKSLEEHVQNVEQGRGGGGDRVFELERRLSEEKRHKANFEEMIKALRDDCESHKNERDNLRDEVVPALRARVEGLEAESGEYQKLTYENTRMQQELQALKSSSGLSRSGSKLQRSGTLGRSNSIKQSQESRDSLAERVKDVEAQRDALHRALKSLLDRQRMQSGEHEKRVRILTEERDSALEHQTPRRKIFEREVTELRAEIDHLRKRADDALAQKWQCEKGLGGLKTDLDRAEQETGSLRQLLQENDILIPASLDPTAAGFLSSPPPVTSATLEQAYRDLSSAKAYAESLREATAVSESEKANLAAQLNAAGQRVEVLSSQVKRQLTQNAELRERLAQAVARGESQQKESTSRVAELQTRLRQLEDGIASAQNYSEDNIQAHEDEVRDLRLASGGNKLQRLRVSGLPSPAAMSPRTPFSPFSEAKSPRLQNTSSGPGVGMAEVLRTEQLESRVRELEKALRDADTEMSEVVQRMNLAQMEVMELQTARDDAMRMTRALQAQLEAERKTMSGLTKSIAA